MKEKIRDVLERREVVAKLIDSFCSERQTGESGNFPTTAIECIVENLLIFQEALEECPEALPYVIEAWERSIRKPEREEDNE